LEYGDNISPFGRNFFNFNPGGYIERRYAMKVFLEAFNIAPSTSTANPFPDIATTDPMFGYMKKAHELGLLAGLPTGSGGCIATCDLSRQDAFIILYRIKTSAVITKPTATQLQDTANYFIPANVTLANMNKIPSIDQANFNHYEKTSFEIPGKGLSLDFTHTYNSFHTELPETYFISNEGALSNQVLANLGIGWSHNYNNYIVFVSGYTYTPDDANTAITTDDKYYIFWGDGSIDVYNSSKVRYETQGTYKTFLNTPPNIIITDKSQMIYRFQSLGTGTNTYYMTSYSDRNGNKISMTYESASAAGALRLQKVTDETTARYLSYAYQTINGKDYLKTITESGLGRSIKFSVNTNGDLASFTDAKGQITKYYYDGTRADETHLLSRIELPKGNIIKNTYYKRKLRSSETNTNKINVNWQNQYSTAQGQAGSTVQDNLSRTTNYQYNTIGSPTSIASPTTTVNNIQYDTGDNIFKPKNMNIQGQTVAMNYDTKGNLLNISRNGVTQYFTYTSKNDVQTYTDGNGNITTYNYDATGNLKDVVRPTGGGTVQIGRNSFGQANQITNPAGIITNLGFDANGNVSSIQMPLNIATSATYDNASRLKTKTDATGYTTSFIYDNNDNLTRETNALNYITDYTYDANDNLTHIKNAKNEITELTYRFDDDFLMSEAFGGNNKSYTYNTDGSLKTFTKATGTFNYTYDATTGRLLSDGQTSYTYDSRNNIKTITNSNGTLNLFYDINDRLDYYDDYFGNRIDYSYDNNGNVKTIIYPGNKTVNYTYDANNRMKDVTDWNNQKTSYTYLIDDRMDKITYANGTYCQYSYDAAGRMIGMQNKKSNGTLISEYSFTLDKTGNHKDETINEPALATALSSLTNGTTNYGPMPFNRIQNAGSTNFTHDGAGNITQRGSDSYTFDLNDNLLSATGTYPATFTYDGSGNRRSKTANGTQTKYILNILGMSQVLLETDQSNTPTNYYIYGATGLVSRIKPNGTTHYYHYDFRGSTVALTDVSQTITHTYAYDAFGNVLAANEPANDVNVYRYNGQYGVQYDAPNRTFMRARYYDPQTGRFISEDPIWATNLYPFAGNNPVNNIDPNGKYASAAGSNGFIDQHASIFKNALRSTNVTADNLNSIINGSNYADNSKFQTSEYAFMHGMISSEKNRTRDILRHLLFINKLKKVFITTENESTAYFVLGVLLHAISDSYSPEHQFKVWNKDDGPNTCSNNLICHAVSETTLYYIGKLNFNNQNMENNIRGFSSDLIKRRILFNNK
jgi:RHS repeat-associated protein